MAEPTTQALWKRVSPIITVATLALIIAILSRAQAVLIPLALAIVVAFFLQPLVKTLERWGLGRVPAVIFVVVLLLGGVGGFGYVLSRQIFDLTRELPRHTELMRKKMAALRKGGGGDLSGFSRTFERLASEFDDEIARGGRPQAVRIVASHSSLLDRMQERVAPIIEPLANTLVTLVLIVFMLIQREDLRNRFIRVIGSRRVTLTTRTMDEAAQRISRFLFVQSLINAGFGLLVTIGLMLIGVPYASLWGCVAAVLRFVPYVGSTIALVLPLSLSFGQFDTWWQTLAILGLYLGLDIVGAYAVEPIVIGSRTGVSPFALLVMTVFWTWLWGPMGLVLATPLTVCLSVLGKQVRPLGFIGVLLGDEPPLSPDMIFYQRLLAKDEDEASDLLLEAIDGKPLPEVYEAIALPALLRAQTDLERGEISSDDHLGLLRSMRTIFAHQGPHTANAEKETDAAAAEGKPGTRKEPIVSPHVRALVIPARGEADSVLVDLFTRAGESAEVDIQTLEADALVSAIEKTVRERSPHLLVIAAAPPSGVLHTQYLCKRIRKAFPDLPIVIVRPAGGANPEKALERLSAAGATHVTSSLVDAVELLRKTRAA